VNKKRFPHLSLPVTSFHKENAEMAIPVDSLISAPPPVKLNRKRKRKKAIHGRNR
jgi:hypothetical protein